MIDISAAELTERWQSLRQLLFGLALLAAMGIPYGAWCADHANESPGPVSLVKTTAETLFTAIDEDRQAIEQDPARLEMLVDEIVMPQVDLARISRWILGKQWRRASPSQRQRFMDEFRKLLVRSYATAVSQGTSLAITYLPETIREGGADAKVPTRIGAESEQPIDITYRLHKGDEGWKLSDVVVAGVSLVATYRSTFAAVIKQGGMDRLIAHLTAKNSAAAQSES
jgi:phospholipid transport system substrate-binding protein